MRLEKLVGTTIAGRFRLGEMVGKGGYGAVFEATQLSMGRRCAVKILLPGRTADEDDVERRFRTEAKNTSRLNHPNTLVVYDFGVDDEKRVLFLVTEFLDGHTLYELLERRDVVEVDRAISLMEQVAGSLADAHDRGLVHRDVKPKNIMLIERAGRADFVKVIDFGIAKALGGDMGEGADLTRTGLLIGTPKYMAPEQIMGGDLDGAADQYALALVGYRMLTGRNPFAASAPMETAMRHLNDRPLPLRTYRPELEVTAAFEDVMLRALEKPPEHRFDDIETFVERLREVREESALVEAMSMDSDEDPDVTEEATEEGPPELPDDEPSGESEQGDSTQSEQVTVEARRVGTTVIDPDEIDENGTGRSGWSKWAPKFAAASVAILILTAGVVVLGGSSDETGAGPETGMDEGDPSPHQQEASAGAQLPAEAEEVEAVEGDSESETDDGTTPDRAERLQGVRESVDTGADGIDDAHAAAIEEARREGERLERQRRNRPAEPARVTVTLIPWGTLYVDGREQSDQVRQQVELSEGRHRLTLRQRGEVRASETVVVEAGESRTIALEAQFE